MMSATSWIQRILSGAPDYERELVERYSLDLIDLARRQLPEKIRRRVDPEDIVQSVYRSFFRRLNEDEFKFDESHDVWRLLAVMTYHKVTNSVKHHRRLRRDVSRDVPITSEDTPDNKGPIPVPEPQPDDLAIMAECLERLLAELPGDYHRIVVMRLEGYSIAEIAEDAMLSRRTVLRVLSKLRDLAGRQLEVNL